MSGFDPAIKILLSQEGKLTDDKNDPGGITNFGVSLRFLRSLAVMDADGFLIGDIDHDGDVDADDIRRMTIEDATAIYRSQWWDRYGYGDLMNQDVANKMLSLSVNMGAPAAHRIAQRALRSLHVQVKEDGVLGPVTKKMLNVWSAPSSDEPNCLICCIRSEAAGYYRSLVTANKNFSMYLNGWLNRAYS